MSQGRADGTEGSKQTGLAFEFQNRSLPREQKQRVWLNSPGDGQWEDTARPPHLPSTPRGFQRTWGRGTGQVSRAPAWALRKMRPEVTCGLSLGSLCYLLGCCVPVPNPPNLIGSAHLFHQAPRRGQQPPARRWPLLPVTTSGLSRATWMGAAHRRGRRRGHSRHPWSRTPAPLTAQGLQGRPVLAGLLRFLPGVVHRGAAGVSPPRTGVLPDGVFICF